MKAFIQVMIFTLFLLGIYTGVANLLPQMESKPEMEEEVSGDLSMEEFIELGEKIFKNKGTCTLCHKEMGRAPDSLKMDMQATAKKRMALDRYHGDAKTVEEYLRESMLHPSVFVVQGFGVKGSNDTKSPMPTINKAPVNLSAREIDAVIAFLQTKDGGTATVSPQPVETDSKDGNGESEEEPEPAKTAEAVINKYGCVACHKILGSPAEVGPSLTKIGAIRSAAQLRKSIIDPMAEITKGYQPLMPPTFKDQMTAGELELVVNFLEQSR